MIKKLKLAVLAIAMCAGFIAAVPAVASACTTVSDGTCKCDLTPNSNFLNFPQWDKYLNGSQNSITGKCDPYVSWPGGVWAIGLAILDILLHIAGIAAVISIIVSAVMYTTSAGNSDRAGAALNRIISSLVGLAIVLVAAAVVSFIGNRIG